MDFKEKVGSLAIEWGVPAALGLAVLGGCEIKAYVDSGKPPAEKTAEDLEKEARHKKEMLHDGIPLIQPVLGF